MKFYNALSDFLYDKNYFITIFENKIHIFKYLSLIKLFSNEIIIQLELFKLHIKGSDLVIKQMNKEELIIEGNICEVIKLYD